MNSELVLICFNYWMDKMREPHELLHKGRFLILHDMFSIIHTNIVNITQNACHFAVNSLEQNAT